MLDVDISELAVIAVVALVVIGPKDLPKVLRVMGQWTRKARLMAGEFQKSVDDMMRESELDDLRKQAQSFSNLNVQAEVEKIADPKGEVASALSIEHHQTEAAAVLPPPSESPVPTEAAK
ncbi:MAG: Sec-independent protein translocase protein TatB [Rhodospirillales bacterium]|nr:Sec-independent protein translocase protein TatB [Rhodospirillales bacterium]